MQNLDTFSIWSSLDKFWLTPLLWLAPKWSAQIFTASSLVTHKITPHNFPGTTHFLTQESCHSACSKPKRLWDLMQDWSCKVSFIASVSSATKRMGFTSTSALQYQNKKAFMIASSSKFQQPCSVMMQKDGWIKSQFLVLTS